MINLLLKALHQNKYSRELPVYKKYSSLIYPMYLKEMFPELREYLPEGFDDFITDLNEVLVNETYSPPTFKHETSDFNNLSFLLEILEDVTAFLTAGGKDIAITIKLMILQYVHLLTLMSIRSKKIVYLKKDAQNFLEKRIQFSQTAIAKEWGIDKNTFSKWLEIIYKSNPFANRKKINLSEYLKMYNDFFIRKKHRKNIDNEFMITDDLLGYYVSAAIIGKTYLKLEIIELGFNLDEIPKPRYYEQAKKILTKKFPYYSLLKKFPNSLALEMIEELKKNS